MKRYGGQAFPLFDDLHGEVDPGMTLLDYFAGQALPEILRDRIWNPGKYADLVKSYKLTAMEVIAEHAYGQAEAMIDRRKALMGDK